MSRYYLYEGYALKVKSEIRLPFSESPFEGGADVTICYGDVDFKPEGYEQTNTYVHMDDDCVVMGVARVGWFRVMRDYIIIEPYPKTSDGVLALYTIGSIWGTLLHLRGETPFHASGFSYKDQGCLIMAESGGGKSTILHGMLTLGARFVTDDLAVLQSDGQTVVPAFPYGKVDAGRVLDEAGSLEPVPYIEGEKEKVYFDFAHQISEVACRLQLIVIVECVDNEDLDFKKVKGHAKVSALLPHVYRDYLVEGLSKHEAVMRLLLGLASNVTVVKIKRPVGVDTRDEVLGIIVRLLEAGDE